MAPVSIVIITKNEAGIIAACINKAKLVTDDIVLVDNGSTDGTLDIARVLGCRVYEKRWDGYGANKNKGVALAKYDWILSIDADEVISDELANALHKLKAGHPTEVYDIKFKSYIGDKPILFGSWGRDHHVRLFNRTMVRWSETLVHETLVLPTDVEVKKIAGSIHHYSVKDLDEYERKSCYYAKLSAKKYFDGGKKAGLIKRYLSPLFGFIKSYIILLGFLDGRCGWEIARTTFRNTYRKYQYLGQLTDNYHKKPSANEHLAVEY